MIATLIPAAGSAGFSARWPDLAGADPDGGFAGAVFAGADMSTVVVDCVRFAFAANSGSNNISAYLIDNISGALTAVSGSPFTTGTNPESLAVDPLGRYLFAANVSAVNQVSSYSITPTSGVLTLVSSAAADALPISLAIDSSGQFLYAMNYNSNDISAFTVDGSGALTAVPGSPFAAGVQPHAIAID